jgi:hypothetical protein
MKLDKTRTGRGFDIISFEDRYDHKCSIQESSIATEDCIWFGIDDPNPQIMASLVMEGGTGWVKYPIPDDVHIQTRMHLSREQVKALLPVLQKFVDTGEL